MGFGPVQFLMEWFVEHLTGPTGSTAVQELLFINSEVSTKPGRIFLGVFGAFVTPLVGVTLPETNGVSHLKIDGWKLEDDPFILERPIFSCELLV